MQNARSPYFSGLTCVADLPGERRCGGAIRPKPILPQTSCAITAPSARTILDLRTRAKPRSNCCLQRLNRDTARPRRCRFLDTRKNKAPRCCHRGPGVGFEPLFKSVACGSPLRRAYRPQRRRGRVAEGGGLLNRYRVVKPYRGFESLRLRHIFGLPI